jgi:hypothetical protein
MKNRGISILILMILTACTGGIAEQYGCSHYQEVCINLNVQEPIQYGGLNTITIIITSNVDIVDLTIHLDAFPPILIEDNGNWVQGWVNWMINIGADQTRTFNRYILLPEDEGFYSILSSAYTNITSTNTYQLNARYSIAIHQQMSGSTVYYANTPIPYTPGPLHDISPELLETLHAIPSPTRYPTFIPRPSYTSTPTPWVYPPPPATPPLEGPGEGPYP